MVPSAFDRTALQEGGRGEADAGKKNEQNKAPACPYKPGSVSEDSKVQKEHRQLGAVDGEFVEYLHQEKALR